MVSRLAVAILLRVFASGETGSGVVVIPGRTADSKSDANAGTKGKYGDGQVARESFGVVTRGVRLSLQIF